MKLQGLYIFYLQNQIKGGISRLAKFLNTGVTYW